MIELMLEAERAMGIGLFDNAEKLYAQVAAADPHNSIAVTGLARVALERGDQRGAYLLARRALAIDPDNPVAGPLARRMAEQLEMRGEVEPGTTREAALAASTPAAAPAAASAAQPTPTATDAPPSGAATEPPDGAEVVAAPNPAPAPDPADRPRGTPGFLARLLRRRR